MNITYKKMVIISVDTGKVTTEREFACATCRKDVGSNTIFCQCCRCLVYKRRSNAKGELKEDIKLKTQRYANQEKIYMAEDYPVS